ncbi:MAG: hypothetical protein M1814_006409 [Vezdaea aestivalis]|nr:MAG: hypothetical protein M1814_006409 [Vezdaea aestivalis]
MTDQSQGPLYIGFDLSTQQLKAIVISSSLDVLLEEHLTFSEDLPRYGTKNGILTDDSEKAVFAPVAMWLEAIDVLMDRLRDNGVDLSRVAGISGAGQQHGSVYWSKQAEPLLASLDPMKTLVDQLSPGAFSNQTSPNWQDSSTTQECHEFDIFFPGGPQELAEVTGSKAHHRFTGPQILHFLRKHPEEYSQTARISLVSSFLASVFLCKVAPIDIGDAGGMNLWDIHNNQWHPPLLALASSADSPTTEPSNVDHLSTLLGSVHTDPSASLGPIGAYWTNRYSIPAACQIQPFTGDNPATLLPIPLAPLDAIISLGTSTTFLMNTPSYLPSPSYHLSPHPTIPNSYMFMLCYKNGSLAREQVAKALSPEPTAPPNWPLFTSAVLSNPLTPTPPSPIKIGLYFPLPEIIPPLPSLTARYTYDPFNKSLTTSTWPPATDAPALLASQLLSLRLRSAPLLAASNALTPKRIYLAGGAANNRAVWKMVREIIGGEDGVWVFGDEVGGNAGALGAAGRACWGCEGRGMGWEGWLRGRWGGDLMGGRRVRRVEEGWDRAVWERWSEGVRGLEMVEGELLRKERVARESPGLD